LHFLSYKEKISFLSHDLSPFPSTINNVGLFFLCVDGMNTQQKEMVEHEDVRVGL
jgi:hypothetical protein